MLKEQKKGIMKRAAWLTGCLILILLLTVDTTPSSPISSTDKDSPYREGRILNPPDLLKGEPEVNPKREENDAFVRSILSEKREQLLQATKENQQTLQTIFETEEMTVGQRDRLVHYHWVIAQKLFDLHRYHQKIKSLSEWKEMGAMQEVASSVLDHFQFMGSEDAGVKYLKKEDFVFLNHLDELNQQWEACLQKNKEEEWGKTIQKLNQMTEAYQKQNPDVLTNASPEENTEDEITEEGMEEPDSNSPVLPQEVFEIGGLE